MSINKVISGALFSLAILSNLEASESEWRMKGADTTFSAEFVAVKSGLVTLKKGVRTRFISLMKLSEESAKQATNFEALRQPILDRQVFPFYDVKINKASLLKKIFKDENFPLLVGVGTRVADKEFYPFFEEKTFNDIYHVRFLATGRVLEGFSPKFFPKGMKWRVKEVGGQVEINLSFKGKDIYVGEIQNFYTIAFTAQENTYKDFELMANIFDYSQEEDTLFNRFLEEKNKNSLQSLKE